MFENLKVSAGIIWYSLLLFALAVAVLIGGVYVSGKLLPYQMDVERDAVTHSRQYVEAKRSLLLKLADDYESTSADLAKYMAADPAKYKEVIAGLENQQSCLLERIQTEAKLIPVEAVPSSILKYLSR